MKGFTIRDLTLGYLKDSDDGSTTDSVYYGFDGKLNVKQYIDKINKALKI